MVFTHIPFLCTAHVELHDIDHYPTTPTARRNNIEKTLSFLRVDGVTLHQESLRGERLALSLSPLSLSVSLCLSLLSPSFSLLPLRIYHTHHFWDTFPFVHNITCILCTMLVLSVVQIAPSVYLSDACMLARAEPHEPLCG